MHTFFDGWRRKAGMVTLVMAALLLVAIWIRSRSVRDDFNFNVGVTKEFNLISKCGSIWFEYVEITSDNPPQLRRRPVQWHSSRITEEERGVDPMYGLSLRSRASLWGMHAATAEYNMAGTDFYITRLIVPYWFCTPPFAIFFAYLILWKQRKRA